MIHKDKSGSILLETQIKVAEVPEKNSVNNNINNMFNEPIPSKNQTYHKITFYHTTSTPLIKGNQRTVWVEKEFLLLKDVLNYRRHSTTSITEAHNQMF